MSIPLGSRLRMMPVPSRIGVILDEFVVAVLLS